MAHNGEVVSYQGTSSLHVARFAKRSEADAAFDALGFHYASVLFKKDCSGLAKKTCKQTAGCAYKKKTCISCSELSKNCLLYTSPSPRDS